MTGSVVTTLPRSAVACVAVPSVRLRLDSTLLALTTAPLVVVPSGIVRVIVMQTTSPLFSVLTSVSTPLCPSGVLPRPALDLTASPICALHTASWSEDTSSSTVITTVITSAMTEDTAKGGALGDVVGDVFGDVVKVMTGDAVGNGLGEAPGDADCNVDGAALGTTGLGTTGGSPDGDADGETFGVIEGDPL